MFSIKTSETSPHESFNKNSIINSYETSSSKYFPPSANSPVDPLPSSPHSFENKSIVNEAASSASSDVSTISPSSNSPPSVSFSPTPSSYISSSASSPSPPCPLSPFPSPPAQLSSSISEAAECISPFLPLESTSETSGPSSDLLASSAGQSALLTGTSGVSSHESSSSSTVTDKPASAGCASDAVVFSSAALSTSPIKDPMPKTTTVTTDTPATAPISTNSTITSTVATTTTTTTTSDPIPTASILPTDPTTTITNTSIPMSSVHMTGPETVAPQKSGTNAGYVKRERRDSNCMNYRTEREPKGLKGISALTVVPRLTANAGADRPPTVLEIRIDVQDDHLITTRHHSPVSTVKTLPNDKINRSNAIKSNYASLNHQLNSVEIGTVAQSTIPSTSSSSSAHALSSPQATLGNASDVHPMLTQKEDVETQPSTLPSHSSKGVHRNNGTGDANEGVSSENTSPSSPPQSSCKDKFDSTAPPTSVHSSVSSIPFENQSEDRKLSSDSNTVSLFSPSAARTGSNSNASGAPKGIQHLIRLFSRHSRVTPPTSSLGSLGMQGKGKDGLSPQETASSLDPLDWYEDDNK